MIDGKIITTWYRVTDDGLKYNHYSDGYDPDAEYPPYMYESQRISWQNATWVKKMGLLIPRIGKFFVIDDAT